MYPRKKGFDGVEVTKDYAAGVMAAEKWYSDFIVWAGAYISLLEKRLQDGHCQCCGECKQCDKKSEHGEEKRDV